MIVLLCVDISSTKPCCSEFLSNLILNVSRDGTSTTFLDNLCWCFTTLTVKNFFLPYVLDGCNKVSPEPCLFQDEQTQLFRPFSPGEVFMPLTVFVALLWANSNRFTEFLC